MTWRQYDNALGRFHGVDAMAAMTPNMTPYHFANNNPIVFSDPSGLFALAPSQQNMMDILGRSTGGGFGSNDIGIFSSSFCSSFCSKDIDFM